MEKEIKAGDKLKAQSLKELIEWQPPIQSYIVDKGILLPNTKLILFGKFETWKSMLALHTAFCIATGKDWFGIRTTANPVYILQIEIPKPQYRTRVLKYAQGNASYPDNIYFRTEHYIKLDRDYGIASFTQEVLESQTKVIIIDPVYKIMTGHITDEWDVRQLLDRFDLLIDKCHVAVVLVHHDRKSTIIDGVLHKSAEDMFGSSMFLDWCDSSIRTSKTERDGEILLSFEKVRHAEEELNTILAKVDRSTLTFNKLG